MSKRRVVIYDPAMLIVHPRATRAQVLGQEPLTQDELAADLAAIDMSDIPNADARIPFTVAVQEQCSLGHWHDIAAPVGLPNWDDSAWKDRKNGT